MQRRGSGTGSGPQPIAVSLERWRRLSGAAAPATMDAVVDAWSRVGGAAVADVVPVALVGSTLHVVARDPAAVEAVRWRSEQLAQRLCDEVGPGVVGRVEVRLERASGRRSQPR